MWNRDDLMRLIDERIKDHRLIAVGNREPYVHRFFEGRVVCERPAGGVTAALDPILRASGGVWVAHGSGDADRLTVDARDHVAVPPEDPRYTLRRVWLTRDLEGAYYYGLANQGLWPLCHVAFVRPVFRPGEWAAYREANRRFADAVLEEAGDGPAFVFIQDYHFGLLPRMLKEANPNLIVAQFWHIPWPNRELFRTFPWGAELLDGMLGNDLLGFQLRAHVENFLDAVDVTVEALVDREHTEVTRGGKLTRVRPFPISIDFDEHDALARSAEVEAAMESWRGRLRLDGSQRLGIGIERLDYTKGIPERLRGLDHLLAQRPEHRGRLVFVQVGVPSRLHVPAYRQIDEEVDALVESINWRWGEGSWQPIVYLKRHFGPVEMTALHRLADFCVVSSIHDGQNLVAKEFVSSRVDEDGVLVLSRFTGAARELVDAVLVNPFSIEELSDAIEQALAMPPADRQRRMQRLRETVARNNVYRWAGKILHALLRIDFPAEAEGT
jgi:trehalose 6-phosphate synthase